MTDQRFIIEMGMGNSLHGMDYQKAAERAINDALRHSTLTLFSSTNLSTDQMRVQVTIGVQEPDKLDTTALAELLPRGNATVTATKGGQNVANPHADETHVIATAAIEAFLPSQAGHWRAAEA
ncbi:MAG: Lin0512 family protein [Pseudomonadota bacterium]